MRKIDFQNKHIKISVELESTRSQIDCHHHFLLIKIQSYTNNTKYPSLMQSTGKNRNRITLKKSRVEQWFGGGGTVVRV